MSQRMVSRVAKLDVDIDAVERSRPSQPSVKSPNPNEAEDPERELLREVATYSPLLVQLLEGVLTFSKEQVRLETCGS